MNKSRSAIPLGRIIGAFPQTRTMEIASVESRSTLGSRRMGDACEISLFGRGLSLFLPGRQSHSCLALCHSFLLFASGNLKIGRFRMLMFVLEFGNAFAERWSHRKVDSRPCRSLIPVSPELATLTLFIEICQRDQHNSTPTLEALEQTNSTCDVEKSSAAISQAPVSLSKLHDSRKRRTHSNTTRRCAAQLASKPSISCAAACLHSTRHKFARFEERHRMEMSVLASFRFSLALIIRLYAGPMAEKKIPFDTPEQGNSAISRPSSTISFSFFQARFNDRSAPASISIPNCAFQALTHPTSRYSFKQGHTKAPVSAAVRQPKDDGPSGACCQLKPVPHAVF